VQVLRDPVADRPFRYRLNETLLARAEAFTGGLDRHRADKVTAAARFAPLRDTSDPADASDPELRVPTSASRVRSDSLLAMAGKLNTLSFDTQQQEDEACKEKDR